MSRERMEAMLAARPRLLLLARMRGVPAEAVEDVVQETLLEAWQSLHRLYDPAGAHRWLDEICRNICRRYARKHALEQRHIHLLTSDDDGMGTGQRDSETTLLQNIPDGDSEDPIEALNRQDMALLLDRALGMLSDSAREVVELCYLREMPQREATNLLGLSLGALEARLHRARRQLRAALNGPLRRESEAFGLSLDDESAQGWLETRLWCTLCGRRLSGMFLAQREGGVNLHMRCADCEQRFGFCDIDSNTVHSKGLIRLDGLRSLRPAWKRTAQGTAHHFTQALRAGGYRCPFCGASASLQLIDKIEISSGLALPGGFERHPYRFWIWWRCHQPSPGYSEHSGLFAASDVVYWSHTETQQFMRDYPRCISEPELLVEYAGQPALRLQLADTMSAARVTVLADRQTLRVLTVYH